MQEGGGESVDLFFLFFIFFHSRLSQTIFVTAGESLAPGGTVFCKGMVGSGALKGSL